MKPFKPKERLARIHLHMQLGKRRTQLEQLFVQREQEIKLLSDYCPSGIIRTDPRGVMTYGNAAWKVHAGMSDQDDILAWPQYVDPAELERLGHEWNEIVDGDAVETTLRWKWANGKSATGTFIRLDKIDSSMSGVIGCIQDTSYQEERIRDAEQRSKELEEQKRQQDLLVDFVSHEIRTPVSAILQCSSLVKQNLEVLREGFAKAGPDGFRPTQEIVDDLAQDLDALESESLQMTSSRRWV
jgi:signal transduction histidine kinase